MVQEKCMFFYQLYVFIQLAAVTNPVKEQLVYIIIYLDYGAKCLLHPIMLSGQINYQ